MNCVRNIASCFKFIALNLLVIPSDDLLFYVYLTKIFPFIALILYFLSVLFIFIFYLNHITRRV